MKNRNGYNRLFAESIYQPEMFWADRARSIAWFKYPEKILSKDEDGLYHWFEGGKLNTAYLALDFHVHQGRGDELALIYDSPVTGNKATYTFRELRDEVALFAGVLKNMGAKKGDRVLIYMPMIPQVVIGMLACARLGVIHSVVFGGFAPKELAIRIDDATPKLILAASGGMEVKKIIPYKPILDKAIEMAEHKPDACILYQRDFITAEMKPGFDVDWEEALHTAKPSSWIAVEATDPLYILYTSGTTGVPKGIVRDHGGHAVALKFSMEAIYGVKPGDVFWAASDVGWVVGHSYIVYAPLIHGCTTILYEGKPVRTPYPGSFCRVIEEYGVNVLFTAPTAFRAIKREDPEGTYKSRFDTTSLKYLFLAGERTDVATYEWATRVLKVPVIDHWWQTESGWPMLSNMPGVELFPIKPGSVSKPVFGYDIQVLDDEGNQVPPNTEGTVVCKLPLPPGNLPDLWQQTEHFKEAYLSQFPGYFFSGDGGYVDENGYVFITGRIDDIINVAGHRLSTAEMEEIIASHKAIAECAVIGIEDALKGQVPVGLVVLKAGVGIVESELEKELIAMVRNGIGPVAAFKRAVIVERLPKTRSGKILRKTMRAMADGKSYRIPSTIEDVSVLAELESIMKTKGIGAQKVSV